MARILTVEDDDHLRRALREDLGKRGYSVLEAKDGVEGLEVALREHPDLILLDVRMPKMDGMAMMHELREDSWGKKASIIILTNYDVNDEQLKQITVDQPSYYLIKANSPLDDILEKIEEVLETKKNRTAEGGDANA